MLITKMKGIKMEKHHHKGKSSESLIDKKPVLEALEIQKGQIILDAGCGDGYMTKEFLKKLKGTGKVYALDPDEESIKKLKNEIANENCEVSLGRITVETSIRETSLDLIYLSTVIHGFSGEEIISFRKEAKRILKKDGRLAILEIKKEETPLGPPMNLRFSSEELEAKLEMTTIRTVDIGDYFYLQILTKK
jgi:ubiquinone/menaquinone biosynthesis C-methylase UbiE